MFLERLRVELDEYVIKKITEKNVEDAFEIAVKNDYYYLESLGQKPNINELIDDIYAIPPNIDTKNKTYVIMYQDEVPICILDFIVAYPNELSGYIGLFMIDVDIQGKGQGRYIINKIEKAAKSMDLEYLELGCIENNKKGFKFWLANGYLEKRKSSIIINEKNYSVISMGKNIG